MEIEVTIKNYRCFPDSKPVSFILKRGFTGFVGANNSGKSTLLKFFYEFRPLFQLLYAPNGNILSALSEKPQPFNFSPSVLDRDEVFSNSNSRAIEIAIRPLGLSAGSGGGGFTKPVQYNFIIHRPTNTWLLNFDLPNNTFLHSGRTLSFRDTVLIASNSVIADMSEFFQMFKELKEILYIGPFRNAINIGGNQNYYDITVGQAFIQAWRAFKTGNNKKQSEATLRLSEDIRRIFGFDGLDINAALNDQTLQLFVDNKSYMLSELGSGLTQFILVFANAATKEPSYIFIDEPELNLHPSLQLDFLTTLASYASEGVVFATHSIGLARSVADRIYSFRSLSNSECEVSDLEDTPRLSEFLGELSYSGYKELGFDKVLLVEGVTEVKTIQQFLRLYKKDHKVVLLPLGGRQFITGKREAELSEIKRITHNISVLIDSEKTASDAPLESKREAFVETCRRLKFKCHVLKLRAIENYLTDEAIKQVKGPKYQALGPYEKLEESSLPWGKEENWRIARMMSEPDIAQTDLGKFLSTL